MFKAYIKFKEDLHHLNQVLSVLLWVLWALFGPSGNCWFLSSDQICRPNSWVPDAGDDQRALQIPFCSPLFDPSRYLLSNRRIHGAHSRYCVPSARQGWYSKSGAEVHRCLLYLLHLASDVLGFIDCKASAQTFARSEAWKGSLV